MDDRPKLILDRIDRKALVQLRLSLKMNQATFARALGVSVWTLRSVETGHQDDSPKIRGTLLAWAAAAAKLAAQSADLHTSIDEALDD